MKSNRSRRGGKVAPEAAAARLTGVTHSHSTAGPPSWRHWTRSWFAPVDIAFLVYFRVTFGLLMIWELWRYATGGQMNSLWVVPEFHFRYYGFGWVPVPSGDGVRGLFAVLILSAAGMVLGLWHRVCAVVFALGFTWLFLIDEAKYLNHFYLICLLGFVSILLPSNRRLALDSLFKPARRSDFTPAWTLWLLRAQMGIVYFYGGIAKLNPDWLHGEPVRTWIGRDPELAVLGRWLGTERAAFLISGGGVLFDLLIVPLLLWRKTRPAAFLAAAGFHLTNCWLFDIGVFPWLAIALTALFFPPDWPRRLLRRARDFTVSKSRLKTAAVPLPPPTAFPRRGAVIAFLLLYLGWQLLMPLRHFLYPGTVSWTEEGHRFSWHMMLRSKESETRFFVIGPQGGEAWALSSLAYLTVRQYDKMNGSPDMILQFAHHISGLMEKAGRPGMRVHAVAWTKLNGRPPALLIDPNVDLAAISSSLRAADWILPLDNHRSGPAWLVSEPPARNETPPR